MPFHLIEYGSKTIKFKLEYSDRKTLAISVLPDTSIIVTAPITSYEKLDLIKQKVRKRGAWIIRQQNKFLQYHPRQATRQYVSGESHFYLGRQYRLKITEGEGEVISLHSGYFHIIVADLKNKDKIKELLDGWYIKRGKEYFDRKVNEILPSFSKYKLRKPEIRIRRMSKRWGSCSPNGIISLNLDLVKAPGSCIEYVIAHELSHLIFPNHEPRFYKLLRQILPDWESRKQRLERHSI